MSTNTENIEARLCAFVEGDLDEQGRAEIEKHLETHPAHRALLEELKRTKVMMMSLPREQAPADLAETLQGHLERSVLLDGVGTDHLETTLKINRWPQLMGVAAVVLLALGLGVLVYVVLPQHSSAPVAMSTKDGLISSAGVGETAKTDGDALNDRVARGAGEDKELGKMGSKPTDMLSTAPAAVGVPGDAGKTEASAMALTLNESPKDGSTLAAAVEDNGRRFGKGAGMKDSKVAAKPDSASAPARAEAKRVYVVVSTDNFETTNGQLASYLATNKIAWQPMNRGVFEVQSSGDLALASRANNQQYRLNITNNTNADSSAGFNGYNNTKKSDNNYQQYSQTANNNFASKGAPAEQTPAGGAGGGGAGNIASNGLTQNGAINNGNQTQVAGGQTAELNLRQQLNANAGAVQQLDVPAAALSAYDLAGSKTESVIVARGLTRQQAADLGQSLDKLYAGQTSILIDRDAAANVGAALGQERKLVAAQKGLEGPADEKARTDLSKGPATTEPSTTQPAEGNKNAETPAVAVTPTTAPATDNLQALAGKQQNEPAADLTLQPQPSTQPTDTQVKIGQSELTIQAKLAPQVAEEPVDVVIVVQPVVALNNAAPAANPPVATEPAGTVAPATQPVEAAQGNPPPVPVQLPTTQPTDPAMGK